MILNNNIDNILSKNYQNCKLIIAIFSKFSDEFRSYLSYSQLSCEWVQNEK